MTDKTIYHRKKKKIKKMSLLTPMDYEGLENSKRKILQPNLEKLKKDRRRMHRLYNFILHF